MTEWQSPDDAMKSFLKAANLGDNPILDGRDPDFPVGLKVSLCSVDR